MPLRGIWVFSWPPFAKLAWPGRHEKTLPLSRQGLIIKCPGLDSNQHSLSATRPSSVRVYQFHHLGKGPQI